MKVSIIGNRSLLKTDGNEALRLVAAIDKAIDKADGDLDLLVAKSAALCCAAQFKKAEEVIDEVLRLDESHFEARMRKNYWNEWNHVFSYPSWSQSRTTLQPGMAECLSLPHQMQLVRDGLHIGVAVTMGADSRQFAKRLSNKMACAWLPIWSETAHGEIVAHYLAVKDDPSNPYKGEGFLPVRPPETVNPSSGYWLIQRLSHVEGCFLVLADGDKVLFNSRYAFPHSLRSTLAAFAEKASRLPGKTDRQAFEKAIRWYQENSDISAIRIDI